MSGSAGNELFRFGPGYPRPLIGMMWAQTDDGVIGRNGGMPWRVPEDMATFKAVTSGHPVIMGRRTWESFPAKFRPLPDRTNIVITRSKQWDTTPEAEGAVVVGSLDEAFATAATAPGAEEVWIIGGGEIYRQSLQRATVAAITVIGSAVGGDTFAPELGPEWAFRGADPKEGWQNSSSGTPYRYTLWVREPYASGPAT
jgi:dihydrofolate reductase